MNVEIELTENDVRKLVITELSRQLGDLPFRVEEVKIEEVKIEEVKIEEVKIEEVKIEVKSKQNYKSEWEPAAFRARYSSTF